MAYYLGIDGGGSKTVCAVGDESSVRATATSGPSNITRVGEARARESLHQAIRDACSSAGIEPGQIERTCVGVAGAGRAEVAHAVRKMVGELIAGEIEVVGDMRIALEAAFGAGAGVIVIAGTGSIAYGRNMRGQTARAGGWGFAVSDEGSAYWIGRAAVSDLLRAIDQGIEQGDEPQTVAEALPLFRKLKAAWSLGSFDEFVRMANSGPDFAALFPAIASAADNGHAHAQRVLVQAGAELSRLAGMVVRRLFSGNNASPPVATIPIAMAGGVFRYSTVIRKCFCDEVGEFDPRVNVNSNVVEPVDGALRMARQGHEPG